MKIKFSITRATKFLPYRGCYSFLLFV